MSDLSITARNERLLETRAVLPWEEAADYGALYEALVADFCPKEEAERLLVERLAWIAWRRRRIQLAERALHLAQVSEHVGSDDGRKLARQGLIDKDITVPAVNGKRALQTTPDEDSESATYNASEDEDLNKAIALLEGSKTKAAMEAALALLREDTVDWWNNIVEDEDEGGGDSTAERAERLLSFLSGSVRVQMDEQIEAVQQRPAIRLMAWGKSLDVHRLMKLVLLDGELDRQFERTLGMLLRLQAIRVESKSMQDDRVRGQSV